MTPPSVRPPQSTNLIASRQLVQPLVRDDGSCVSNSSHQMASAQISSPGRACAPNPSLLLYCQSSQLKPCFFSARLSRHPLRTEDPRPPITREGGVPGSSAPKPAGGGCADVFVRLPSPAAVARPPPALGLPCSGFESCRPWPSAPCNRRGAPPAKETRRT